MICDEDTQEKDLQKFKPIMTTLSLCLLGKQLSELLIEHGTAIEETVNVTPTQQEISKTYELNHPI